MLGAVTLAPVQEISQPFGVRRHGLGVFEKGLLAQELPYLIRHAFAIGIAILLGRYATAHSVKRSCLRCMASTAALKSIPTDSYFNPYRSRTDP